MTAKPSSSSYVPGILLHSDQSELKRTKKVQPSGHAGEGGIQKHSIGDTYPFTVYGRGADPVRYGVLNCATGEETPAELTCAEAHTLAEQLKGAASCR